MKISLNWLKDYLPWTGSVPTLSDTLTFAGVEVEGIEQRGANFEKVVVAQILESKQHPNADRLSVCQVDDGSGEPRQIVCGAKNYKVGDKVPLALPGALLPGDLKIKAGKLRDVKSDGMMCSAKELRLAEDADGLLILPAETKVGIPISEALPSDTVIEIEVTPNRPDLLSHLGLARELGTLAGLEFSRPKMGELPESLPPVQVELKSERCPFYCAVRLEGVKVGPSPEWLKTRLESVGLRSINNIVDITNFVMFELGQPLHAFDAAQISTGIVVRDATEGEEFLALDGKSYKLTAEDLVIADSSKAVAIAGVMGGEHSGVTASTQSVILESAWFQPQSVRRTSRKLGLISDSSYRFERRVDPAGVLPAAVRAAELISQLAGGTISAITRAGTLDVAARSVPLRFSRCNSLIGVEVAPERVSQVLNGFGLTCLSREGDSSTWAVPSFRADLEREVDLIEEVCRVHGMDNIPGRQFGRFAPSSPIDLRYDAEMKLRQTLVGCGFAEIKTVTLISNQALENDFFSKVEIPIRLKNPLGEDQAILRPSLSPGLMDALARNVRQGARDLRLFELGSVFGGEREESRKLGLLWTGASSEATWRSGEVIGDFFDFKGVVESIIGSEVVLSKIDDPRLATVFEIRSRGKLLGRIGQLAPSRSRALDVREAVFFAELELLGLAAASAKEVRIKPLPKFPAVTRDAAILAPLSLSHGEIESAIRSAKEALLVEVNLFDLFTDPKGEKLPADQKSMAYSFTYRSPDRTLTAEEVTRAHDGIKKALTSKVSVTFRE